MNNFVHLQQIPQLLRFLILLRETQVYNNGLVRSYFNFFKENLEKHLLHTIKL